MKITEILIKIIDDGLSKLSKSFQLSMMFWLVNNDEETILTNIARDTDTEGKLKSFGSPCLAFALACISIFSF